MPLCSERVVINKGYLQMHLLKVLLFRKNIYTAFFFMIALIGCGGEEVILEEESVLTGNPKDVRQIALGYYHTCAVLNDGSVKCWGNNGKGQLGNGESDNNSLTPVDVSGLSGVSQISLGYQHSCAVLNDKTVKCWGDNVYGQLGNNTTEQSSTPVDVSGLSDVSQISLGDSHGCARLSTGAVKCWGYNGYGQLGNNSTTQSPVPIDISSLSGISQISLGRYHSCAVLNDKTVKCWGYNSSGQLGNNSTTQSLTPVAVKLPDPDPSDTVPPLDLSNVSKIDLNGIHSCAILEDKTVKCWGSNSSGQLGNNSTTNSPTSVDVSGLSGVSQIALGGSYTCAALVDDTNTTGINEAGTVKCWGNNNYGELGNNSTTDSLIPVDVFDLNDVSQIAFGIAHSCVLLNSGNIKCWGSNTYNQLGFSTLSKCGSVFCSTIAISIPAFPVETP